MIDRLGALRPATQRYLDLLATLAGAAHGLEITSAEVLADVASESYGGVDGLAAVELAAAGDQRAAAWLVRFLGMVA